MFPLPALHRIPRAHIDPIRTPGDALRLILTLMSPGTAADTMVVFLDDERCGLGVCHVHGTDDPDTVIGVVDSSADAARASCAAAGLIVATMRPQGTFVLGDLERWHQIDAACADADIDLVEWFVIGSGISSPRTFCGVPARWND